MNSRTHGVCSLGLIGLLSACQSNAERPLRVFAASSLTDVMAELALVYEAQGTNSQVVLSTGGSHILRLQIENGAEAQIFASASPEDVMTLVDAGHCQSSAPFAGGTLSIYHGSEAVLNDLSELSHLSRWIVGSPDSPIGRYTRQFLDKLDPSLATHIQDHVVSVEQNVRLIRSKIDLGAADAGIVYTSDIVNRPDSQQMAIPADLQPDIRYVMAQCGADPSAEDFQRFVTTEGQAILTQQRFVQ